MLTRVQKCEPGLFDKHYGECDLIGAIETYIAKAQILFHALPPSRLHTNTQTDLASTTYSFPSIWQPSSTKSFG